METYKQALEDAKEELQSYLKDNKGSLSRASTQDYIHELADSATPIYNGDILEWAIANLDFAVDTPELGPAFDGSQRRLILSQQIFMNLLFTI